MSIWIADYKNPGDRDHHFTFEAETFISAEMVAHDIFRKMNFPEGARILRVYSDADSVPDEQVLVLQQQSRHDFS